MTARAPRLPKASTSTPLPPDSAIYVAGAFIGRSGVVDFAHQNARPVHGGVRYRDADNSARAQRRRVAREAARQARRGGGR